MANNESFIDEVNEEVRRERLYRLFRRYAWIGITVVVLIVAGASVNEYRKASARAAAEDFGNSVLAALDETDPIARAGSLSSIPVTGPSDQAAVLALLAAGSTGDPSAEQLVALEALSADPTVTRAYRDLAALSFVMLSGEGLSPQDRISRLQPIALPGAPYALLANEQIAMAHLEQGNTDLALETLRGIAEDNAVTPDLSLRVSQVILALDGATDQ